MTPEELAAAKADKIAQITSLLGQPGNTTKLVRFFVLQALNSIEDLEKMDQVIAILLSE